jgi:hypothetical protein
MIVNGARVFTPRGLGRALASDWDRSVGMLADAAWREFLYTWSREHSDADVLMLLGELADKSPHHRVARLISFLDPAHPPVFERQSLTMSELRLLAARVAHDPADFTDRDVIDLDATTSPEYQLLGTVFDEHVLAAYQKSVGCRDYGRIDAEWHATVAVVRSFPDDILTDEAGYRFGRPRDHFTLGLALLDCVGGLTSECPVCAGVASRTSRSCRLARGMDALTRRPAAIAPGAFLLLSTFVTDSQWLYRRSRYEADTLAVRLATAEAHNQPLQDEVVHLRPLVQAHDQQRRVLARVKWWLGFAVGSIALFLTFGVAEGPRGTIGVGIVTVLVAPLWHKYLDRREARAAGPSGQPPT